MREATLQEQHFKTTMQYIGRIFQYMYWKLPTVIFYSEDVAFKV